MLTVWETLATRLALAGAFAAGNTTGGADMDAEEESYARSVAEEGALRASEHGYTASPMVKESFEGIPKAIFEAADQLSARLIVCGQRGRGCFTQHFARQRLSTLWHRTPDARSSLLQVLMDLAQARYASPRGGLQRQSVSWNNESGVALGTE